MDTPESSLGHLERIFVIPWIPVLSLWVDAVNRVCTLHSYSFVWTPQKTAESTLERISGQLTKDGNPRDSCLKSLGGCGESGLHPSLQLIFCSTPGSISGHPKKDLCDPLNCHLKSPSGCSESGLPPSPCYPAWAPWEAAQGKARRQLESTPERISWLPVSNLGVDVEN